MMGPITEPVDMPCQEGENELAINFEKLIKKVWTELQSENK